MTLTDIAAQALYLAFLLAAPLGAAAGVVGLVVSVLQAATRLQEHTLTTIPKMIALGIVIAAAGAWMLRELVTFGTRVWEGLAHVG